MPAVLRIHAEGDDVRLLQGLLNAKLAPRASGLVPLVVDGKFGPLTGAFVIIFQQRKGLLVDQVVGPQTWGALLGRLFTIGRSLYDALGHEVILRGMNLPLLDDFNFPGSDGLSELVKTKANAVRIEWYVDYGNPQRPAYSTSDLDAFLKRCRTARVIPIVSIFDGTVNPDLSLLTSTILPWWTAAAAMLNTHQKYLIVNLANELGFYEWSADPDQALADFVTAYKNAITTIRQVLHVPIMIDAPDGGTRLDVWKKIGRDLIDHDPDHNLLLSAHAYWAAHDWTREIGSVITLPIVFGEIANFQDEDGEPCRYSLTDADPPASGFTYQDLLKHLQVARFGWLAWSWGPDQCASRQVSSDGTLSGLTTYGQDLAHNTTYGWEATAIKSSAF